MSFGFRCYISWTARTVSSPCLTHAVLALLQQPREIKRSRICWPPESKYVTRLRGIAKSQAPSTKTPAAAREQYPYMVALILDNPEYLGIQPLHGRLLLAGNTTSYVQTPSEGTDLATGRDVLTLARDLARLERAVAFVTDDTLLECQEGVLVHQDIGRCLRAVGEWNAAVQALLLSLSAYIQFLDSRHLVSVARNCLDQGQPAVCGLLSCVIARHQLEDQPLDKTIVYLVEELLAQAALTLTLGETLDFLLDGGNLCVDSSSLSYAILRHRLTIATQVSPAAWLAPKSLRIWLIQKAVRHLLHGALSTSELMRLGQAAEAASSSSNDWRVSWRDPEATLLLVVLDGNSEISISTGSSIPRDGIFRWVLPWQVFFSTLKISGNLGVSKHLISRLVVQSEK